MSNARLQKPGTILVVDDDESVLLATSRLLARAGHKVIEARNGREATGQLSRETFDAVLSDIGMPEMDGIALLRAVRERDGDVPGHPGHRGASRGWR